MLDSPSNSLMCAVTSNFPTREAVKNDMASTVQHYLNNLYKTETNYARREHVRHPFPAVISLTPVDPNELTQLDEPILVIGKQISLAGLGFFHTSALLHSCFLVWVHGESIGHTICDSQLVLRTKWCRFLGKGLYESGGQFVTTVPIDPADRG